MSLIRRGCGIHALRCGADGTNVAEVRFQDRLLTGWDGGGAGKPDGLLTILLDIFKLVPWVRLTI